MADNEASEHALAAEARAYYARGGEAARLTGAEGELELLRTQEIISRYLPAPPAEVLDVGGGPGAYACWLAQRGYTVHLVDPVPLHLEQARAASARQPETPVQSFILGDARRLDWHADAVDCVLLLGPLYHLTQREERLAALREAWRVLRRGGLLVAVGISRYASTLAGLIDGYFTDPRFLEIMKRDLTEGQHRNPTGEPRYFTTAFFHHPVELADEVRTAGFALEALLAVEGAAVFLQDLAQRWSDPDERARILDAVRWLEAEPAVIGVTGHIAAVAHKPG